MPLPIRRNRLPIPQEVIDLIVSEARDDELTLAACSLVSSALLPTSRRHLFSRIAFECGTHKADRYEQFHTLTKANPILLRYVRELHIDGLYYDFGTPTWDNGDSGDKDPTRTVPFPAVLSVILKSLWNLSSLNINTAGKLEWDMLHTRQQNMFLQLIASAPLRSIAITGIVWPLSSFMGCTRLRELVVSNPQNDLRQGADLALRAAQLELVNVSCNLDVLSTSFGVSYPALRNFTAICRSLSDIPICEDIFRSAAHTLETLQLSVEVVSTPIQAEFIAMRHLSIEFTRDAGIGVLQWLLTFLEKLSAHQLEDLSLSIYGNSQDKTFENPIWSQIHALLTHELHLPRLHYVTVRVTLLDESDPYGWYEGEHPEEDQEAINSLKQRLVSNSKVEFGFTSPSYRAGDDVHYPIPILGIKV